MTCVEEIDELLVNSPKLMLTDVDYISHHYTNYIYFSIKSYVFETC